jgi:hypothetical protein
MLVYVIDDYEQRWVGVWRVVKMIDTKRGERSSKKNHVQEDIKITTLLYW